MVYFDTHSSNKELPSPSQSRRAQSVAAEFSQMRSNVENTIWGKVVASPESGPW